MLQLRENKRKPKDPWFAPGLGNLKICLGKAVGFQKVQCNVAKALFKYNTQEGDRT